MLLDITCHPPFVSSGPDGNNVIAPRLHSHLVVPYPIPYADTTKFPSALISSLSAETFKMRPRNSSGLSVQLCPRCCGFSAARRAPRFFQVSMRCSVAQRGNEADH